MSKTCNENCLCLKCSKACKRACEKCNSVFKMGVRSCKGYTLECVSECTQLSLNDFLGKFDETVTRNEKMKCEGFESGTDKNYK